MEKATLVEAKWLTLDDPVRPEISAYFRVTKNREMYYEGSPLKPCAVICVAYGNIIPISNEELKNLEPGDVAIFYTVWASGVKPAAGRNIVIDIWEMLKERGACQRYVTMSPKTDMARKFHLRNGAVLIAENEETNNFEYK
jgi:hypothetical protein